MYLQNRIDAVLDLETLGTSQTAPILEIGAVLVTREGLGDTFQNYVRLDSALLHGKPDASTILWWMDEAQNEARKKLVDGLLGKERQALALRYALGNLDLWLRNKGATALWANGASFDLGALSHAYSSTGVERQFDFRLERDLRTAFDLRGKPERKKVPGMLAHCGLHDAMMDGQRLWEVLYGKG